MSKHSISFHWCHFFLLPCHRVSLVRGSWGAGCQYVSIIQEQACSAHVLWTRAMAYLAKAWKHVWALFSSSDINQVKNNSHALSTRQMGWGGWEETCSQWQLAWNILLFVAMYRAGIAPWCFGQPHPKFQLTPASNSSVLHPAHSPARGANQISIDLPICWRVSQLQPNAHAEAHSWPQTLMPVRVTTPQHSIMGGPAFALCIMMLLLILGATWPTGKKKKNLPQQCYSLPASKLSFFFFTHVEYFCPQLRRVSPFPHSQ